MVNLPTKYILPKGPKEYLQQGLSHCGAYSVKGILSFYGLDNRDHPKYYHPHWIGRLTGLTFGKDYYIKILKSYGINAERNTAEYLDDKEKISLIKKLLSQKTPIIIRIGNGYLQSNKYNLIIGKILAHWITLWGYDDEKQLFYVYDSGLPKKYWNKNILIGNTTRTYQEFLRDWRFGSYQPWVWPFSGMGKNLYIKIKK